MASLESVRQKIIWVERHRQCLIAEANRYFETKPCIVVPEEETETGRFSFRVKINAPVPPEIPLIIGDILQNLRSALDYLVWELVLAANNVPSEKNMFPICSTAEAFNDQLRRHRLDGVAPDAITEIERLQPYGNWQNWGPPDPLTILDTLSNINKHRRVLLTVLSPHIARTEMTSSETGKSIHIADASRGHDTEIAVTPRPSRIGETVDVEGKLAYFITFNDGPAKRIEIGTCLLGLSDCLGKLIIPKFERFF
jgi:hypothetical protein